MIRALANRLVRGLVVVLGVGLAPRAAAAPHGTEAASTSSSATPTAPRRVGLSVAWLGEDVFHPGAQIGVEVPLVRAGGFSLIGAGNVGGYVHHRYAAGVYVDAELGTRFTARSGFLVDLMGGVGYLHVFPYGPVYDVPDDGGAPTKAPVTGRPAFRPGGTLGLGADLSGRYGVPLAVVVRVGAFGESGYNGAMLVHPQVMAGVVWTPAARAPGVPTAASTGTAGAHP